MRPGTEGLSTDVCVPLSKLADCVTATQEKLDELGLLAPIVGHVGDGNFHTILLFEPDNAEEKARVKTFLSWLNGLAISMEGTCTGEHGIGQGKQPYLRDELGDAVDMMAMIKRAIDPDDIMNPGKII